MADTPPTPDTTELVKQLLERLAISTSHEEQAASIRTLQTESSETRAAVESLKADHDKITTQQASLADQSDKLFVEVYAQLSTIQALKEVIADLKKVKEELRADISAVKNNMQNLKLQVAAQDGLRVLNKNLLHSSVASSQQGEQFEDEEDAMSTDLDAAIEPEMPPSDPDVSMTLAAFQMPTTSIHASRYATPEYTMPPPNFVTPKHPAGYGATTPGSVNTMMPDTVGFNRYDGPFQIPHRTLFGESFEHYDENVNKRSKRARRHSVAPLEILALSPITEDNELLEPPAREPEPITSLDKTLWRESWQQSGKQGTLEEYARAKKVEMLHSDITEGIAHPRKRYTASDFDKLPAPQENKRKRASHQPNTAQPLAAVELDASQSSAKSSMPPPSSSQTRRPSRASKIPGRFGGNDVLTGKAFLAATNSRTSLSSSQARNETANPSQKSIHIHADDDDDEELQTPGKAASSLLQQFGSRKTKVSKNATK